MRVKNHYYCVIAGLPELIPDQTKLRFSPEEFKEYLYEELKESDFELIKTLYLTHDHCNLLNLLQKNDEAFDPLGNYSNEFLEEAIKEPEKLPSYMEKFVHAFKNESPLHEKLSWENQLTWEYYRYVTELKNTFLSEYFRFEWNLKNVMTGLMTRKYDRSVEGELVGEDMLTHSIRKSHAKDFGIANEFPEVELLISVSEKTDLLEREKEIDLLKWKHIDQLNTFNYFTIEVILGHVLKTEMVNRWLQLDEESGREMFKQLLNDMKNSFKFPIEFNINGRKGLHKRKS
ncbi:MAG: DUF2764 domain-containing protein [Bacteroidales bacterium]|nr:DUF2764 domain-containing protein [Bacteroidales bacterium]MCF8344946.1 DUF2764 domain-containing protein [Bacteroidales bacterium]MCF8352426.1 DUF2764 domain-containing protein [Bacteroidales bacterium]MCF8375333.1 DUF2764 domain-containing protein [Bacteroidales bacterium]MCF8400189.1 DUF2764 domain-containing protein [Bacteroidales bacterium]